MKRALRITAAAVASLGFALPGLAAAQSGSIDTTGPDSHNEIEVSTKSKTEVDNNNVVTASNTTAQTSETGDARVRDNTTAGDVATGSASNENATSVWVSVSNSMPDTTSAADLAGDADGSISNTGPDSHNEVEFKSYNTVEVTNNNTAVVSNTTAQTSTSGDANASHNTTVGDVSTGDASNSNTSEFTFEFSN